MERKMYGSEEERKMKRFEEGRRDEVWK